MRFVECTVHCDRVMKFIINFYNHIAFLYDHHAETNFNKFSGITNSKDDAANTWNHHYQVNQD